MARVSASSRVGSKHGRSSYTRTWPLLMPNGRRTSIGTHYNQAGRYWASGHHTGIDLGVGDRKVRAAADGVVESTSSGGPYGNHTVIRHPDGTTTLYAHQAGFTVHKGDKVKAGDQIGVVGATGNVTGPHLHFEVRNPQGQRVDPAAWLAGAENLKGDSAEVVSAGTAESGGGVGGGGEGGGGGGSGPSTVARGGSRAGRSSFGTGKAPRVTASPAAYDSPLVASADWSFLQLLQALEQRQLDARAVIAQNGRLEALFREHGIDPEKLDHLSKADKAKLSKLELGEELTLDVKGAAAKDGGQPELNPQGEPATTGSSAATVSANDVRTSAGVAVSA